MQMHALMFQANEFNDNLSNNNRRIEDALENCKKNYKIYTPYFYSTSFLSLFLSSIRVFSNSALAYLRLLNKATDFHC